MTCYNISDIIFDGIKQNASIGLGQIKPSTAQAAEQYYADEHPGVQVHDVNEIIEYLKNDSQSVHFIALVLWHSAKLVDVWIDLDYDYSNSAKVLARYNGTGDAAARYGAETHAYLDPFVKYYWEVY